jgi:hypothetical protein
LQNFLFFFKHEIFHDSDLRARTPWGGEGGQEAT